MRLQLFQRRLSPASIIATSGRIWQAGKQVLGDAYQKSYRSPQYYKSADWRGTWAIDCGGALMNQGVHRIDLIQWLMGEVNSVFAYSSTLVRDIEVECSVAVVKYKNGAFGMLRGTTSVYPGQGTRFEIHGEHGTIIFDDTGFKQWKFADVEEKVPQITVSASAEKEETVKAIFIQLRRGKLARIYFVRNPDKLTRVWVVNCRFLYNVKEPGN